MDIRSKYSGHLPIKNSTQSHESPKKKTTSTEKEKYDTQFICTLVKKRELRVLDKENKIKVYDFCENLMKLNSQTLNNTKEGLEAKQRLDDIINNKIKILSQTTILPPTFLTTTSTHYISPNKYKDIEQRIARNEVKKEPLEYDDPEFNFYLSDAKKNKLLYRGVDNKPYRLSETVNKTHIIRPRQIENLSLSGGGAKGYTSPCVLTEMEQAGTLKHLKNVSGASAGSIAAAVYAVGGASGVSKFMDKNPMIDLVDEFAGFNTIYKDDNFKLKSTPSKDTRILRVLNRIKEIGGPNSPATNIIAKVDEAITTATVEFLKDIGLSSIDDNILVDEQTIRLNTDDKSREEQLTFACICAGITGSSDIERLKTLQKMDLKTCFTEARLGKMITFNDLLLLNKLDPKKFKLLTISGLKVQRNDKDSVIMGQSQTRYFNADTARNMPIAYAARISSSLPVIFQSVEYNGQEYVDGALEYGTPVKSFTSEANESSAILAFADDDTKNHINSVLYQKKPVSSAIRKFFDRLGEVLLSKISNIAIYSKAGIKEQVSTKNDIQALYNSGANTFITCHDGIGTVSFSADNDTKNKAKLSALEYTTQQLANTIGAAYYQELEPPLKGQTYAQLVFSKLTKQETADIFDYYKNALINNIDVSDKEHIRRVDKKSEIHTQYRDLELLNLLLEKYSIYRSLPNNFFTQGCDDFDELKQKKVDSIIKKDLYNTTSKELKQNRDKLSPEEIKALLELESAIGTLNLF